MKVWLNTHFYFPMQNDIMYIVKKYVQAYDINY